MAFLHLYCNLSCFIFTTVNYIVNINELYRVLSYESVSILNKLNNNKRQAKNELLYT